MIKSQKVYLLNDFNIFEYNPIFYNSIIHPQANVCKIFAYILER